jgi:uncharacterized repeat protein (TIGR02543 family)
MAIRISKNVRIILYVLLGLLVLSGSGYLIWRINQPDTVAPEDSEAACPDGCTTHHLVGVCTGPGGCRKALGEETSCKSSESSHMIGTGGGATELWCCDICDTGGGGDDEEINCTSSQYRSNSDQTKPIGQRCTSSPYTYECGVYCYTPAAGPGCCTTVTSYTLRYSAGTGGSITGNSSQTVNKGGSGTAVTAVADTGYTFLKWSDDNTTNPRTDSNVQGNINVTAQFEESAVTKNSCTGATWIEQPEGTYNYCTSISSRVENRDEDGIDTNSIVVKLNGETKNKCSGTPGEVCYQTNIVDGKTRILMNLNNNYCLEAGSYTLSFEWKDGLGNSGCNLSTSFSIAPQGEVVVEKGGDTVPQTGLLDTVFGGVSLGFGFIFLGGLVSQYSKLNYMYESMQEKSKFRREISKEKRMSRARNKFERRVR